VIHLGERDCSVQRRHQKIIEESPSPAVDPALRARMGEAAVAVVRAAGYRSAGTVEFMLDSGGHFYFLEVNTRLQVEHPVTEWVTGLDLVHLMLHEASGEPLSIRQEDVRWRGHAIEARIYAEDPENGFLPSAGEILLLHEPQMPGLRIDSGIRAGGRVSVHYDPILSKVIAYHESREGALRRLQLALRETAILGVRTNIAFLQDVLAHPVFQAGKATTRWVEQGFEGWRGHAGSPPAGAFAAALIAENGGPPGRAGVGAVSTNGRSAGGAAGVGDAASPESDPYSPWKGGAS
jgi:acetyl/propionyl-CoA carboxylase alpha subunit